MAKYTERLNELLESGVLTQEQHDELADLSIAKEAIKEFNEVKRERDEAVSKVSRYETLPKLKESLGKVGINYDDQPKYAKEALDRIPADKLDDLEHVATYVQEQGFQATPAQKQEGGARPAAEAIVNQGLQAGSQPITPSSEADFHRELDAVPDGDPQALREVLAKHGRLAQDQGAVQNV